MTTLLFLGVMVAGTFALGLADVWKRKYLVDGVNEQALLAITMVLTGGFLGAVLFIVGMPEVKEGFWGAFAVTVLGNTVSQNLYMRAFKLTEASLIGPLKLITPPLVIFTAFLFLGETPSIAGIAGIFITVIGLWLLLFGGKGMFFNFSALRDRGVMFGLISAVMWAVQVPFDKVTVVTSSPIFAGAIVSVSIGLLTFLWNTVVNHSFPRVVVDTLQKYGKANILIGLSAGIGTALTNQGYNYALTAFVSSLKRLWS